MKTLASWRRSSAKPSAGRKAEATCAVVEQAGGLQLRIISPRTVLAQLGREQAREMFEEGTSVAEVVLETPLSS